MIRIIGVQAPRVFVGFPSRIRRENFDPIESLRLAVSNIVLESSVWTHWVYNIVIAPRETMGTGCPPCIAKREERCAIGGFNGMLILCRTQETAAQRIFLFLRFRPLTRGK